MTNYPETVEDPLAEENGTEWEAEPILTKSVEGSASPEFSSCMTWNIPQAGIGSNQPVQLLQRRIKREKAKLILVNLNGATSIMVNNSFPPLTGLNPQGAQILALTYLIEWESQQPCYAIAIGGGPAVVSVIDECYADR